MPTLDSRCRAILTLLLQSDGPLTSAEIGLRLGTTARMVRYSLSEGKWLRKGETVIVVPASCASKFKGDVRTVKAGDSLAHRGLKVEVVPAYNIGKEFHPKEAGGVGYIVTTVEGMRVYHAGDTDLIPEMENITADVALLPVGGKYTMDAEQAARAANLIRPKLAIPMHWGTHVDSRQNAERFRELCKVEVRILKPQP